MSDTEIRLHIDRLEYTRGGLRTREPVPLVVGNHNRVVLVRPQRQRPAHPGSRAFPEGSALPLVGALRALWAWLPQTTALVHEAGGRAATDDGVYQIFAHASDSGDDDYNKDLSDRRADVGRSFLTGDPDGALAVARSEGWGVLEGQSMLRCLGCDPGPLDGDLGKLSAAAVATFVERFNRGVFPARSTSPPRTLPEDARWSDDVRDALLEAMVAVHGLGVTEARLHPVHPAHGCSEFNAPPSESPGDARRLVVLRHPEVPEFPDAAPCRKGDASACAVVDERAQRCLFYREHVNEPEVSAVGVFDPRWLWIDEDRYVLSVLTDAPDGDEVTFEVLEDGGGTVATLRVPAAMGTAAVVWKSQRSWEADGRPDTSGHPSFVATHVASSANATAPYPRRDVFRILLGDAGGTRQAQSREHFRVVATDGSYDQTLSVADHAVRLSPRKLMLEFHDAPLDVVSSVLYGFDPDPGLPWMASVRLAEVSASRHGAESMESPVEEPPSHDEWAQWEHPDRVGAELRKYAEREPLKGW
ncbi:MAG: hypothetical protein ACE37F_37060 [Nannocystaceae bacterium]|nr:hypothetical protein [bacterium]